MNIFDNFDVTYELNHYTKNFKFYNKFRIYRIITHYNFKKKENYVEIFNNFNKIKKRIKKYSFNYTSFSNTGLKYSKGITCIQIYKCNITNKGFRYLKGVMEIGFDNKNITYEGLKYIKGICDTCIDYLMTFREVRNFKGVRHIYIKKKVNDEWFKYLIGTSDVYLYDCENITSIGYKYLSYCDEIVLSDMDIKDKDLKYFENANYIRFEWCSNITDNGIKYLKRLKAIDIHDCSEITINVVNIYGEIIGDVYSCDPYYPTFQFDY